MKRTIAVLLVLAIVMASVGPALAMPKSTKKTSTGSKVTTKAPKIPSTKKFKVKTPKVKKLTKSQMQQANITALASNWSSIVDARVNNNTLDKANATQMLDLSYYQCKTVAPSGRNFYLCIDTVFLSGISPMPGNTILSPAFLNWLGD